MKLNSVTSMRNTSSTRSCAGRPAADPTEIPSGLRRFFRYSFLSFFALSNNGEQYDPGGLNGSINERVVFTNVKEICRCDLEWIGNEGLAHHRCLRRGHG